MNRPWIRVAAVLPLIQITAGLSIAVNTQEVGSLKFEIAISPKAISEVATLGLETPITGRVFVLVTKNSSSEPRMQVDVTGIPFWGMDVRTWGEGTVTLESSRETVRGYPLDDMRKLPPGEYVVQAVLNVYTTFHRSDGRVLELHLPAGEGQVPWRAPGNVRSEAQRVSLNERTGTVRLTLDHVIPPLEPLEPGEVLQQGNPRDSSRVKFIKIQSPRLSAFWGRPMFLGANVLLPKDYDEQSQQRYPVIYLQGHFPGRDAPFDYVEGGTPRGRARDFPEFWSSDQAPRVIAVTFRDENPYYDTSYSVNSANVGPYGDALTEELIPEIDRRFRTIAAPWARVLAGGSTGGWEALAMQVFYPDLFGGTWSWCPDSVDFRYHQIVNIYEDHSAYESGTDWVKVERPNARKPDGNITSTVRQENYMELAIGPESRSGGQWAAWEAVYGPVGANGYPAPIWDARTGVIDHAVAEYWREHFDLRHILQTRWPTLGPKLAGKIHLATGDMDTYYLEEAVYLLQELLEEVDNPPARATFAYGRRKPHCWIGASPTRPREDLTFAEFVGLAADYMARNAPTTADRAWLSGR